MGNYIPNITPDSVEKNQIIFNSSEKKQGSFDAKNYLNVRLDESKGEKKKTLTFRLLPMDLTNGNPFLRVHTHNVKVPNEVSPNGYKSYICLSKNEAIDHSVYGYKCPFCEINKTAYDNSVKETDEAKKAMWKEISLSNVCKDSVIVRGIERGAEADGVKFWKFNIRTDNTDPYNQLMDLYYLKKEKGEKTGKVVNIFDIYNGRDFTITITEGTAAPIITLDDEPSMLTDNEETLKQWIYDDKKWQDVFSVKPYEYLRIISLMKVPFFDKNERTWVDKETWLKKYGKKKKDGETQENTNKLDNIAEQVANNIPQQQYMYSQMQQYGQVVNNVPQQQYEQNSFHASITINGNEDLPFKY